VLSALIIHGKLMNDFRYQPWKFSRRDSWRQR